MVPFSLLSEWRRDLRERPGAPGQPAASTTAKPTTAGGARILALRREQARAARLPSYADYALADTMAGTQAAVGRLLDEVWTRAVGASGREHEALQLACSSSRGESPDRGLGLALRAEKVRRSTTRIDEAEVLPHFPLEPRMVEAVFDRAQRRLGLEFVLRPSSAPTTPTSGLRGARVTARCRRVPARQLRAPASAAGRG